MASKAKGGPAGAPAAAHADIANASSIASFAEAMEDRPIRNEKDKKSRADRTSLACSRLGHLLLSAKGGEAKDVEFWWPILIVEVKALVGGSFAGHNLGEFFSGMSDNLSATGINLYDADEELKHAVEKRILSTCGKLSHADIAAIAGFFKTSDKPPLLDLFPALDKKLCALTSDASATDSPRCQDRSVALANFKACCEHHKYVKTLELPGGARQAALSQRGFAVGHEQILLQQQEEKRQQRLHIQRQQQQIQQFQLLLQQKREDDLEWEKKHQELEAEIAAQRAAEEEERQVAEAIAQVAALEAATAAAAENAYHDSLDWESKPQEQLYFDQQVMYEASYPQIEECRMSQQWGGQHQHQQPQQHQQAAYGQVANIQQTMYSPPLSFQRTQPWEWHQQQHAYGGARVGGYENQGFGERFAEPQEPTWGLGNQTSQPWDQHQHRHQQDQEQQKQKQKHEQQHNYQQWAAAGGGLPGPVIDPNADIAGASSIDEFIEAVQTWPADLQGDNEMMNRAQADRVALAVARFGHLLNSSAVGRGSHFSLWTMLLGNVKALSGYFSASNLGQFFSGMSDNLSATGINLYEADERLKQEIEARILLTCGKLTFSDIATIAGHLKFASTFPHWDLFPALEARLHDLCSNPLNFFSTSGERSLAVENFRACCRRHGYIISATVDQVLVPASATGEGRSETQQVFDQRQQEQQLQYSATVEGQNQEFCGGRGRRADEERVAAEQAAAEMKAREKHAKKMAEEAQRQEQLEQERQAEAQEQEQPQDDDAMIDDLSKLLLG